MMPWDWIGIVTIRSDTRCSTSASGMITRSPGARAPSTRPSRNSTPCSYCFTIRTDIARTMSSSTATITTTMIRTFITRLNFRERLPEKKSGPCRAAADFAGHPGQGPELFSDNTRILQDPAPGLAGAGSWASAAGVPPGPARMPGPAGLAGEQVVGQQQDCCPDDGRQPGGEVEETLERVDVEDLRRQPAAQQGARHADQAGDDQALLPAPGDQHVGEEACCQAENNPGDNAHDRLLSR